MLTEIRLLQIKFHDAHDDAIDHVKDAYSDANYYVVTKHICQLTHKELWVGNNFKLSRFCFVCTAAISSYVDQIQNRFGDAVTETQSSHRSIQCIQALKGMLV